MSNNKLPYAVKLQMPFARPFTDPEWFDNLKKYTVPPYWWNWKPEYRDIGYLVHPLKGIHWTSDMEIVRWPDTVTDYVGQVDIDDNEISSLFIHPQFTKFLSERDLQICNWDVFITPPNMRLGGHKDTDTETVKLNFAHQFVPGISQQNYLTDKDDSTYAHGRDYGDDDVRDVMFGGEVIHYHNLTSDRWDQPSLTNVGLWHEVINKSPQPRVCLSYQLKRKKDLEPSLWYDVLPLLEDCIIE